MRILTGLAVLALLATPAMANLLGDNGGFEVWPNDWEGNLDDSHPVWGPGGAYEGDHYGSVQTGGNNGNPYEAWVTSMEVPASEVVTLTGVIAGGTNGQNADIYIQLIDGSSSGDVVVDELRINIPVTYGFGWTPIQLSGHIASGHIKVKAGLQLIQPIGWSNGTAIHMDALELVPEPASLGLFALAGLPLLRRRR
jgi:hypothetical protein